MKSSNEGFLRVLICLRAAVIAWIVSHRPVKELDRYPGPWLARYAKLWYRLDVKSRKLEQHLIDLDGTYGDVVRICL